ncbi:recombinase family protein [Spongiactinospora gelatinilytica]|uniref:Recombinase family protein n=2 Tax=Spongiactinospora gelatinilytica TaxID=2666298 RepID=A0A2W2FLY1_9ACTN|nr:recombinase family protein [Spongiactinospora gelatinilytica]
MTTRFGFYGRVSTEDQQDPESSRAWQLTRAKTLVEPRGGVIVAEYFDISHTRALPWKRRPQAAALLEALRRPDRGFDAVVIGEPHRAFYDNQFGLTFPVFNHFGVPLWVPEVGGPIDPNNEAHDLVMSVFGGMSKAERNRIKIRVRTAMEAQTRIEGRYLGGRPPYGYHLVDLGPHPNPAKANDGKRLSGLAPDPVTSEVVKRIFAEYIAGHGLAAIAENLTKEGISSPAANDRRRNPHRCGIAWSKFAVRAILLNPRYTGYQVWNRQRTDEVLLDVDDVALGHTAKMRWNDKDAWIWSERPVHEPLIDIETFHRARDIMAGRGRGPTSHKPHRARHDYVLRGCVFCHVCERRMEGHWANKAPYYRCRFPQQYAIANKVEHPRNVCVREDAIVPGLDHWLALEFSPQRLQHTIDVLLAAADGGNPGAVAQEEAKRRIAECDRKLSQYRAALDAGGDPLVISQWITQTQADRAAALAARPKSKPAVTRDQIARTIENLGDMVQTLREAPADKKNEIYRRAGVRAVYNPANRRVRVWANPPPTDSSHWELVGVRGLSPTGRTCPTTIPNVVYRIRVT